MPLSIAEIRDRIHDEKAQPSDRLAILPILDWEAQGKPGQAAIDLRLGQRFRVPRRTRIDHLDHLSTDHTAKVHLYGDDYHVWMGDYFVLHPRQFVLGHTLEWIHLPADLSAYVIGRSSWGRDGLIIATAIGVHPGYSGVLTLELTNLGEIPLRLYPGLAVAQLFIHTVGQVSGTEVEPSAFGTSTRPSPGDPVRSERQILARIRTKRGLAGAEGSSN